MGFSDFFKATFLWAFLLNQLDFLMTTEHQFFPGRCTVCRTLVVVKVHSPQCVLRISMIYTQEVDTAVYRLLTNCHTNTFTVNDYRYLFIYAKSKGVTQNKNRPTFCPETVALGKHSSAETAYFDGFLGWYGQ